MVYFNFFGATGKTMAVTLQRLDNNNYWNFTSGAWEAAPTFANKKLALTEGSSEDLGSYKASSTGGGSGSFGSPGLVLVRYHDDGAAGDAPLDIDVIEVRNNAEILRKDLIDGAVDIGLDGSVNDVSPAAGSFKGDAGLSATDDFYNNSMLQFTSGVNEGQMRPITDYTGATKLLTFSDPFPAAPADTDTFKIGGYHT